MALEDLPEEIISRIIEDIKIVEEDGSEDSAFWQTKPNFIHNSPFWVRSLASICLTSRKLNRIATPYLYHSYTSLERFGRYPFRRFLHTIINNPDLAVHVKKVRIGKAFSIPSSENLQVASVDDEWDVLFRASIRSGLLHPAWKPEYTGDSQGHAVGYNFEEEAPFYYSLKNGLGNEARIQLLVSLLPNLQSLHLHNRAAGTGKSPWPQQLLRTRNALQKLQELSVEFDVLEEWHLSSFVPLFQLSLLTKAKFRSGVLTDKKSYLPDLGKLSVTTLGFYRVSTWSDAMRPLLVSAEGVETFEYNNFCAIHAASGARIVNFLKIHSASLKQLSIAHSGSRDCELPPIGSLVNFNCLQKLTVSIENLMGHRCIDYPVLTDLLPHSLQSLVLIVTPHTDSIKNSYVEHLAVVGRERFPVLEDVVIRLTYSCGTNLRPLTEGLFAAGGIAFKVITTYCDRKSRCDKHKDDIL
ncbi:hypothetical protein K402DRAFT_21884 [Aulographum hederae CBS 113979]|uniref:F-box domain-containing protein n=1 Tax=Aulographum hederae CBS 113979 TaxID=1176131 RepID=A0A6G1H6N0_9PEZI|nr:hypothetical protein K402DRAFT_21884 [Aulographum hederae CBS 113979]